MDSEGIDEMFCELEEWLDMLVQTPDSFENLEANIQVNFVRQSHPHTKRSEYQSDRYVTNISSVLKLRSLCLLYTM